MGDGLAKYLLKPKSKSLGSLGSTGSTAMQQLGNLGSSAMGVIKSKKPKVRKLG